MDDEIEWTPIRVRLGDLSHWADNPVTLSKAQAKKLLRSKEKLGKMQTLAIGPSNGDGKHPLYDGHQRANVWGAAFGMGLEVWALQSSRALTDDERHAVPIMLRTAIGSLNWDALAGWTDYPLGEWGLDEDALQGMKFDIAALGNLLESETPEPADAEPQIDRAEELNEKWQVKTGDLWRIGEHRLLCGDSTRREDVERVMQVERLRLFLTDPPYGVDYAAKNKYLNAVAKGNSVQTPIENDRLNAVELQTLWLSAFKTAFDVAEPGCPYYVHSPQGGDNMMMMMMMMKDAGWLLKPHIIWVKNNHVLGRSDYQLKHEPILYGWKDGTHWFYGDRSQFSVWEIDRPQNSDLHPTMKPVALIEREIVNSSKVGEIVGDWFVGSGTTIVACQNLGRKCRAIEISPAYCAVALERMATAFPGIEIARID